jgi:hypothetical protein
VESGNALELAGDAYTIQPRGVASWAYEGGSAVRYGSSLDLLSFIVEATFRTGQRSRDQQCSGLACMSSLWVGTVSYSLSLATKLTPPSTR